MDDITSIKIIFERLHKYGAYAEIYDIQIIYLIFWIIHLSNYFLLKIKTLALALALALALKFRSY
jgi:hypothetical protein